MMREIILHIGTHKTGSTTLQKYLADHRPELNALGVEYYRGILLPDNHIDLYLSCLDRDKDSMALRSMQIGSLETVYEDTHKRLSRLLNDTCVKRIIFSTEGLSLLRSNLEMERLTQLVDPSVHDVKIVCVLRDKSDYLNAYRKQILKVPGRKTSNDPRSALYVEADSWLADYESLLIAYRTTFGAKAVRLIDYDREVKDCGDVLPAILREMSIPESMIPKPRTAKRENTTSILSRLKQTAYSLRVRFFSR